MQHVSACRHINLTACPDVSESSPDPDASRHAFTLVRDVTDPEVAATESRRLRRAVDFLAAVRFMIEAGFHRGWRRCGGARGGAAVRWGARPRLARWARADL